MSRIRSLAVRIARGVRSRAGSWQALRVPAQALSTRYWTRFNVTHHHRFASPAESLDYFHWRNDQYPGYIDLMPVSGQDGKVVLDYGCGPGHDVIGFGVYSRPKRLIAADVSPSSLAEAQQRATLHGLKVDFVRIDERDNRIPVDSESVDYIHSSGVIHHIAEPLKALRELRRVLAPGGRMRVMVYNYWSIWLHFHVAYSLCVKTTAYPALSLREVFAKTTDGENCPVSNVYKPEEFCALAGDAGFDCQFIGAGISNFELKLFAERFDAIMDQRLPAEHRDFLKGLELDRRGYPMHNGTYAGVDGCFELRAG